MRLTSSYLNEVTVTNEWRCSLATRLPILASGLVTLAGHYDPPLVSNPMGKSARTDKIDRNRKELQETVSASFKMGARKSQGRRRI